MNSLPLNPEIVISNKTATIIFYEVLPVAEFANCMYWHDIDDKSLISLGKVKISRVYHGTYKGFTDRTCADDFSLVHFYGAFVAASQIVTVVEFEAEHGLSFEPKKEGNDNQRADNAEKLLPQDAMSPGAVRVWSALAQHAKLNAQWETLIQKLGSEVVSCETCSDYVASSIKSQKCFTCGDKHINWSLHHHRGRPEPENIDDAPRRCSTCRLKQCGPEYVKEGGRIVAVAPLACRTCGDFKNWLPR